MQLGVRLRQICQEVKETLYKMIPAALPPEGYPATGLTVATLLFGRAAKIRVHLCLRDSRHAASACSALGASS